MWTKLFLHKDIVFLSKTLRKLKFSELLMYFFNQKKVIQKHAGLHVASMESIKVKLLLTKDVFS